MPLFTKAIPENDLAEAIREDAKRNGVASLTDDQFCRATSMVDYWDWESDCFPFQAGLSHEGNGWGGPTYASMRYDTTNKIGAPCHYSVQTQTEVGDRITIPLQWIVWHTNAKGEFPLESFIIGQARLFKQTGSSAYSGKFVRDFYEWFSKPEQNPVLKLAMNYMTDVEWYRTEDTRLYGFSFTLKEEHLSVYNLLALSRVLCDGYYYNLSINRQKEFVKWRDLGYSMRVAFAMAERRAQGVEAGHKVFEWTKYTMFNWLTDNPNHKSVYWNHFWNTSNTHPFDSGVQEDLDEYLSLLKKDGFEIGPTHAK